jgi:multicomponent Na+:H+ antiporter subunit C
MILVLAIVTGSIFSMGVYMLLRRNIAKLIIGFILLSHAANLTVFLSGDLVVGGSPIIPEEAKVISEPVSDPLPQALILTAIVISFGLLAFSIILISRVYKTLHTEDLNQIRSTEKI